MIVRNLSKDTVLADNCALANKFLTRFLGLMGKKELPMGSGLQITPCNSIHMFFMKLPLDVIFLDKHDTVVHMIENIKPWQVSKIVSKARSVIELPVGTIAQSSTEVGDRLILTKNI